MGLFGKKKPPRAARPVVPCPHCGAAVAVDAQVCRACGYDWDQYVDHPDTDAEDDFDYDAFLESEFSTSPVSTTLRPWQRAVVIALVAAFAATLLWPVLF